MNNNEELCKYCIKKSVLNKVHLYQIGNEQAMKLCQDPKCISAFIEEDPTCLIRPHNLFVFDNINISEKTLNEWENDLDKFLDYPAYNQSLSLKDNSTKICNGLKKNIPKKLNKNVQNQNTFSDDLNIKNRITESLPVEHNHLVTNPVKSLTENNFSSLNYSNHLSENANINLKVFSALRKRVKPKPKSLPKFEPFIPKCSYQVKSKGLESAFLSKKTERPENVKNNDIFEDLDSFLNQCDIGSDNVMAEISNLEKLLDSDVPVDIDCDNEAGKSVAQFSHNAGDTSKKSTIEMALEKYLAEEASQQKLDMKNLNFKNSLYSKSVKSSLTKPTLENMDLIQRALSRVSNPSIIRALNLLKITKGLSVNINSSCASEAISSKPATKQRQRPIQRKTCVRKMNRNFAQILQVDNTLSKGLKIAYKPTMFQSVGINNGTIVLAPLSQSRTIMKSEDTNMQSTVPLIPFIIMSEYPRNSTRTATHLSNGKRSNSSAQGYNLKRPTFQLITKPVLNSFPSIQYNGNDSVVNVTSTAQPSSTFVLTNQAAGSVLTSQTVYSTTLLQKTANESIASSSQFSQMKKL